MSEEINVQCWICPYCYDDHGQNKSACKVEDLRNEIERLRHHGGYQIGYDEASVKWVKRIEQREKAAHIKGYENGWIDRNDAEIHEADKKYQPGKSFEQYKSRQQVEGE